MMDCLVTGGAGFIGSNLVRGLLGKGEKVRVLDDLSTGRAQNIRDIQDDVEIIEGSILDSDAAARAVNGVSRVFHLAALPSVPRSIEDPSGTNEVNVIGTLKMLKASRGAGVDRFVFSSSSSVYGNTPVLPKQEDMVPRPLSPYALQKLAGENYCRIFHDLYGLKTYSLRYFNVFGPRQNPESQYSAVIPKFISLLKQDMPPEIDGDGEQTRDFTYVDNIVSANICCCDASHEAAGRVYNVARGDRISVSRLANSLVRIMGKEIEPVYGEPRTGDVKDSQADSTRAREKLGWKPEIAFDKGLRSTVEWFMNND